MLFNRSLWGVTNTLTVRQATLEDLNDITEIYNEAILKTVATFDTEPKTIEEQKNWFQNHGKKYPLIVAEEENKIVGWAALTKYSTKCRKGNDHKNRPKESPEEICRKDILMPRDNKSHINTIDK